MVRCCVINETGPNKGARCSFRAMERSSKCIRHKKKWQDCTTLDSDASSLEEPDTDDMEFIASEDEEAMTPAMVAANVKQVVLSDSSEDEEWVDPSCEDFKDEDEDKEEPEESILPKRKTTSRRNTVWYFHEEESEPEEPPSKRSRRGKKQGVFAQLHARLDELETVARNLLVTITEMRRQL